MTYDLPHRPTIHTAADNVLTLLGFNPATQLRVLAVRLINPYELYGPLASTRHATIEV
jgi:hypothetical protein